MDQANEETYEVCDAYYRAHSTYYYDHIIRKSVLGEREKEKPVICILHIHTRTHTLTHTRTHCLPPNS